MGASNYPQLNDLKTKYGDKGFEVLGFPCNQFGLQENSSENEILPTLKYVRPGGGYEPNFPIFGKVNCNGSDTHPIYKFLREAAPEAPGEGVFLTDTSPKGLKTSPTSAGEVRWNFEKFLVSKGVATVKRYHPTALPEAIDKDIAEMLK